MYLSSKNLMILNKRCFLLAANFNRQIVNNQSTLSAAKQDRRIYFLSKIDEEEPVRNALFFFVNIFI